MIRTGSILKTRCASATGRRVPDLIISMVFQYIFYGEISNSSKTLLSEWKGNYTYNQACSLTITTNIVFKLLAISKNDCAICFLGEKFAKNSHVIGIATHMKPFTYVGILYCIIYKYINKKIVGITVKKVIVWFILACVIVTTYAFCFPKSAILFYLVIIMWSYIPCESP